MRLTKDEITSITSAIAPFITGGPAELRLFGSRVDDNAKGGDIDLLLIAITETTKAQLLINKFRILAEIKQAIGDQKIDLKIADINETTNDPFISIILPGSILLHKW
ncbi:MAG: nucleotidyltransferase domain-containing protein [Gammaproteobacteria bacterium]|nr:nucleotidyltransferase domain-containing protein [Gammaproteobacteria bacterium]